MKSGNANGTVTIKNAYTYGLDNADIFKSVQTWADGERLLLRNYAPSNGRQHYLRVVSRVYVTGGVGVTISNDESNSAGIGIGSDRPLDLPTIKDGATAENFAEAMNKLNNIAASSVPGAKIKFITASSRSITLNEDFDNPLVIGYLGFDLPILAGGRVGAPISTVDQLNDRPHAPIQTGAASYRYRIATLNYIYKQLSGLNEVAAQKRLAELDALQKLLPKEYPFTLYTWSSPSEVAPSSEIFAGSKVGGDGFKAVLEYLGNAQTTSEILEKASKQGSCQLSDVTKNLVLASTARDDLVNLLARQPAVANAMDYVMMGD